MALIDEMEVGLVNQRRRLQRVRPTLPAHAGGRTPAQFTVDERYQLLTRVEVTFAPRLKQRGHVGG